MLQLLRRYQKVLFIVVFVVIVISFSFFGTFAAVTQDSLGDQVAFTAVDGTEVKRRDFDPLFAFVSSDVNDIMLTGTVFGGNALNDGVIGKDFLRTGLAQMLIEAYPDVVREEFSTRLAREKQYLPYAHPQVPGLSTRGVWSVYSPQMITYYEALREQEDPLSSEGISARTNLFLAQQDMPPDVLRRILYFQMASDKRIPEDPRLVQTDFALFGYHSQEEWFGRSFLQLVAQFIHNASIVAEQRGYHVSRDEALADLYYHADHVYKASGEHKTGFSSAHHFFYDQLRRLGLDEAKAVRVWRRVMLFRSLFGGMADTVFLDLLPFQEYGRYASEFRTVDLYKLSDDISLNHEEDFKKLEAYLHAVTPPSAGAHLAMPTSYRSADEVEKLAPELVEKRYKLRYRKANKPALQVRIGLKELLDWELTEENWIKLSGKFPQLQKGSEVGRNVRFKRLETLDIPIRERVDAYARSLIVQEHPAWLEEAFDNAIEQEVWIGIRTRGGRYPFEGVEDRKALMELLDRVSLVESGTKRTLEQETLWKYSGDGKNFYRIEVVERVPDKRVLTFAEAKKDGTLAKLVGSKEYMSKVDVDAVKVAIDATIVRKEGKVKTDYYAIHRYDVHVKKALEAIKRGDGVKEEAWLKQEEELPTLDQQWKFVKVRQDVRRNEKGLVNGDGLFAMDVGGWSGLLYGEEESAPTFVHLVDQGERLDDGQMIEQVEQVRKVLGDDAQRFLMVQLLDEIKGKGAITFDHLKKVVE
ncbi:hypothetical protein JYU14_01530 [Simkania negevensis]|uniref:PpiC domain-containing protein n=1 Tax=Simkania negevensis TaxID=83561 RepID=A0ABS3ARK8_9BACT|nr:hypothetical protein [Simkania negevensis]